MEPSNINYEDLLHEQNYWPLQVVQDEFACALDIPLQIYKKSAVENLWEQESILRERFSTQKAFHDYVSAIATNPLENVQKLKDDQDIWQKFFTEKREKSCWLTTQSAGYFLIHSFQESQLWRWWEFLFYYHQFIISSKTDGTAYYFDHELCTEKHLHIAFKSLSLTHQKDCIVVAGPVWNIIETIVGSDFETQRVEPFVNNSLEFIKNKIITHKPALVRMGNNRFPMTCEYLRQRLERAVDSLKPILKTTLPVNRDIHRCDHVKLAEWALFTLQIDKRLSSEISNELEKKLSCNILNQLKEGKIIYARLDHPEIVKKEEQMLSPWVKTQWDYFEKENRLIPNFHIQYDEPNKQNRIESLHTELPTNFNESDKEKMENDFTIFLNQTFTRRSARKTEALVVLRKWLNDRFRIVTEKKDTIEIYEWLCHWIADRVTADQVTLYYYNHGTRYLKKIGFYGKTDESEKWKDAILDYMIEAAKNEEERQNSICYRCIDEHRAQFTRMFDPKTKKAIPNNKPILSPPKSIKRSNRSAIATPIFVYKRVWGVLEINGISPYQFCWNNKTFIEELTSLFSPFFYQQHLLDRLQKLNKITVEEKTPTQIYQDIAHQLAVIFLSHSATLWMREQNCQYKCVGWYERPDIEEDLSNPRKNEWDSQVDTDIIHDVIDNSDKKIIRYQSVIGETFFDQNWIDSQPSGFQKLNIKHVCILPIYKLDETTPMGCIFLYNQTEKEVFDNRWLPTISRVSQHVTLLLEAMQIQQKREKHHKDVIAHEIKRNANFIEDRATHLRKYVNRYFKPNPDQKHRLHNLTHDLEIHTQDLLHDIKWLSSDSYKPREYEYPLVSKAEAMLCEPKQWLNFLEQFNIEARSHWDIQKKRKFEIHYDYAGFSAEQEIYIEMHAYNLRQILGNLLDNAIKYNLSDTPIEAELTLKKYELVFVITNRCPCLKEGEEFRIFDEGFRGVDAENVAGDGKGLFIVKQICNIYNLGFKYKAEPDPYIQASCLHHFVLSFPQRFVKLVKKGEKV